MSFSPLGLPQDHFTFVKKDGTVFREDVPATIGREAITTYVVDLPIEVGDHFLRKLPNGLVEDYIVDNPRYSKGLGPIPPNYQVKVHRSDAPAASSQSVIANFHGANSRLNINSTDSSSNTVLYQVQDLTQLANEFAVLRGALLSQAQTAEQYAAIGVIASAELEAKSGKQPKISALGAAGRWVLDTATKIGIPLATSLLKIHCGLPP